MKMRDLRRKSLRFAGFRAWTFDFGTQVEAKMMVVVRGKKLLYVQLLSDARPLDEIRALCRFHLVKHARARGLL